MNKKFSSVFVSSPLTGNLSKKIGSYNVSEIVEHYQKKMKFDTSYLFNGVDELGLYCCPDTGYIFFYPGIEGDATFYAQRKKDAASYMDWKWEHNEAISFITDNDIVLEIGSGAGGFLLGLKEQRKTNACGLELNPAGIEAARKRGIVILDELLQDHAIKHTGYYDVACSFQVLEHIQDVKDFMLSSSKCLKSGGKLIISVPDNESFVGDLNAYSNMPPYHVGRYTIDSLKKIGILFGFKVLYTAKEPLQKYHYQSVESIIFDKMFENSKMIGKLISKAGGRKIIRKMVNISGKWMNGHSLFIVLQKSE